MPVLVIYERDTDEEPLVVYSGATWVYQVKSKKLTVWMQDVQFDYPCEKMDNKIGEKIFMAYCEIVPPEEQPDEVIGF